MMMRKYRALMANASLRFVGMLSVLTLGLCGCLGPLNEAGIVHTPRPTQPATAHQEPLFPETLTGVLIPRACVREMPLRVFDIIGLDLSPNGEWLVGTAKRAMSLGVTPAFFLFFHNLETGESRVLPRHIDVYKRAELDSQIVEWDGSARGLYYLSNIGEGVARKLKYFRLSDGYEESWDCDRCTSVNVEERLGLVAYVRVTQDKEGQPEAKRWELEIRRWRDDGAGPLLTMQLLEGAFSPKLSPSGRQIAYQVWDKRKLTGSRFYIDLVSGDTLKLGENNFYPWMTDEWVLEPDREAPKVWKYNLETNSREVFVEFAPDALIGDERQSEEEESVAVWSATIGGRDRQYLIFVPLYNEVITGRLHVADLRCALQQARYQ